MMDEEEEPAPEPAVAEKPPPPPVIPLDDAEFLGQKILVLPFLDSSGYKGSWDIHNGVAGTLADSLAHNSFYHIVPGDSALAYLETDELLGEVGMARAAAIGSLLGADWVILGDIEELTMKRFQATVNIGGYRSYEGIVMVNLTLVNAIDGRRGGELSTEGVMDSKRTGITNPAAFVPPRQAVLLPRRSPLELALLPRIPGGQGPRRLGAQRRRRHRRADPSSAVPHRQGEDHSRGRGRRLY